MDLNVECAECHKIFERKPRGAPPKRCPDCRTAKKRAELDKLRAGHGFDTEPYYTEEKVAELDSRPKPDPEPVVPRMKVETDPSWLDDPEIQDRLKEQRVEPITVEDDPPPSSTIIEAKAVTAATTETIGSRDIPAELGEPYVLCSVPTCRLPPTQVDRFCLNHWLRIPLELRGVLLGTGQDTAQFSQAVLRAIRGLRP